MMFRLYKIFRAVTLTAILVAVLVPVAVYVVLSTPGASEKLRQLAERELTGLLGTDVSIQSLSIRPFSTVSLSGISVNDDFGKRALAANSINARLELWESLKKQKISVDYVEIRQANFNLYKEDKDAPLNISGIIERLKSDNKNDSKSNIDFCIYTISLQDCDFRYDVKDIPLKKHGFDVNHISVEHLDLLATAPQLSNEKISAQIRDLRFKERNSGFVLNGLEAKVAFSNNTVSIEDLEIDLTKSKLLFGNTSLNLNDLRAGEPFAVKLLQGSYLNVSDLSFVSPKLESVNRRFDVRLNSLVSKNALRLDTLKIEEVVDGGTFLEAHGRITDFSNIENLEIEDFELKGRVYAQSAVNLAKSLAPQLNPEICNYIYRLGKVSLNVRATGNLSDEIDSNVKILTDLGALDLDARTDLDLKSKKYDFSVSGNVTEFDLGGLLDNEKLGIMSSSFSSDFLISQNKLTVSSLETSDTEFEFQNHVLSKFDSDFALSPDGTFAGSVSARLDDATLTSRFDGDISKESPSLRGNISFSGLDLNDLGIINKYENYGLSADITFDLLGEKEQWIDGFIEIRDINYVSPEADKPRLHIDRFNITANNTVRPETIEVTSDFFNGNIQGQIALFPLVNQARNILADVLPGIISPVNVTKSTETVKDNKFFFDFVLDKAENIFEFFNAGIVPVYAVGISGRLDAENELMTVGIDAPYLMKGDMIIEGTTVESRLDGCARDGNVYLTTQFPTKKGMMIVTGGVDILNDTVKTQIDWKIERDKPLGGILKFDTHLFRDRDNGQICVDLAFQPSEITFGNDVWKLNHSEITYKPKALTIRDFKLHTNGQSIDIDGACYESDDTSEILIKLEDVVLNTIFETLDINKALIGGVARGTLHAGGIFSSTPFLTCDNLHVKNIGYNYCVLGDGDIKAQWDNELKSFKLDAVVRQDGGRRSFIKGDIFPMTESLDISFDADSIPVGFMKPFMDAFAEDISGNASGKARIFGDFKYIDMEGDVYAHNLGLKVGFTNTWYYASDSIHIVPGLIDIDNVIVRDVENHTALLNGSVKHNFFKDPEFDFRLTDAHNFLSYDVTPALSPDWYGKIYGNGSAFITGSPGVVNIDVDMTTAQGSTFTFVLSDMEEAEQYNFITFRDKNRNQITDSIIQKEILPEAVLAYKEKILRAQQAMNPPSVYNMNIQMDITPAAKIIIVMDPVGGDEIKSWGRGNMRMTYTSVGNELRMFGTYAIDRGSYNFTLQDIIVKDFIIKEGSSITFTGDPYNATLDITASYLVNANLSDLDESFINDPELNRTNVPVHALLLVKGDMRQPDIDFDLEFPTLTSDVYRKVRSIISTDEMMNRQMIYLLALNRFYTPEYMTTTKGNELFSVASSTISSRLSSMLGKLSENWTISPNLRSDKGDFSDVQFDVALSSNLLNNRLRMNGNFGYRDKSLNTTQFIGDFDLEYLLNRSGSWRLKAYNRFNDQTYFLRTAKTTQGVGIKFQREFDNMFGFLRKRKKKEEPANEEPDDSINQK